MGQSESRPRSPPEHQQPQEKLRRRLRNSIHVLLPTRRHSTANPEPRVSRRWRRAFCFPSPSPSLVDVQGNEESAIYEDAEEKGDTDADSDTEEVLVLPSLDNSGHEAPTPMPQVQVPHLRVPEQQAEVPDAAGSQVDDLEALVEDAGEGVDAVVGSDVEAAGIGAPLDDLVEETLPPAPRASELSLPTPAPGLHVDDPEALEEDAGEGVDAVVDSDVEDAVIRAPLDDLVEETPMPVLHTLEPSLPTPAPDSQVDDLEALEEDAGQGVDVVIDSDVEDAGIRVPLDDPVEETSTSVLHASVLSLPAPAPDTQIDDLEAPEEDAGEGDLAADIPRIPQAVEETSDGEAEEGDDAVVDSDVEAAGIGAPLDDLVEETLTPVLHASELLLPTPAPGSQVDHSEALDNDAGEGVDAVVDSDVEDASIRAPLVNLDADIPQIPHVEVPQGDEETSDREAEEGGEATADSSMQDVLSRSLFTSQAIPTSLVASVFARAAAASAHPGSSLPANAPPSSSADTLPQTPPPNLGNIQQAASAPVRRPPSPVRQSPSSPTPYPSTGSSRNLRTGDKCYVCGEFGHWGNSCPNDPDEAKRRAKYVTCWTCGGIGHYATDPECPSSPANAPPSSSADTLPQTPPPNLRNIRQAASAPVRRPPSPVWQSPSSPTPYPSTGSSRNLRTGGKCYVCGEFGHWGNSCPNDPDEAKRRAKYVTCWTCGGIGHYATDPECPSSPANASPFSSAGTLPRTPPPNLATVRQAASAPVRRPPSPVWQSPSSPTPYPSTGSSRNLRTGDKCYVCGEFGHWGNSCPNDPDEAKRRAQYVTCAKCGRIGHYATDPECPRRRSYRR
ncbi:hypothetical protein C8F04DRAFT_1230599 [Mycena alexandri]|uniref:CCHC-type domain-containing protein n=1 Tax=Mycena alexandri TaxID=1745969 RepID=A0AAD6T866_9AGAR|nr:hypothetical protein C8F04DRAFT_1230599 [Mycena alexandri]